MRFAFVSDIHANLQAWRAVWADTVALNVDRVICLGDIVGYGPRPAETLTALYAKVDYFVVGNHDAAVAGLFDATQFTQDAQRMIAWTRDRLGKQAFDFIKELPYAFQIDGGGFDAACVHASMSDPAEFDYIFEEEDARAHWAACEERLTFVGHTHVPQASVLNPDGSFECMPPQHLQIEPGKRYIINVGSVGMPRDDDFRAVYCVYDTVTHTVSWHRTAYDVEGLKDDIRDLIGSSAQAEYMLASFESGRNASVRELLDFAPRKKKRTITVHRRAAVPVPQPLDTPADHSGAEPPEPAPSRPNSRAPVALWIVLGLFGTLLMLGAPAGYFVYKRTQAQALRTARALEQTRLQEQREALVTKKQAKKDAAIAALQAAVDQGLTGDRRAAAVGTQFDKAQRDAESAGLGAIATATRAAFEESRADSIVWPDTAGDILIPRGGTWRFHDSAQYPGEDWMSPDYRASDWSSGRAPLGYGDTDKATVMRDRGNSRGTQPYMIAYFRKTFEVTGGEWVNAKVNLLRDDGAVVYLNGQEVWRSNMPEGKIGPATHAKSKVSGLEEKTYYCAMTGPGHVVSGINVIAVSVHQDGPTSSDIGFDLELIGYRTEPQ